MLKNCVENIFRIFTTKIRKKLSEIFVNINDKCLVFNHLRVISFITLLVHAHEVKDIQGKRKHCLALSEETLLSSDSTSRTIVPHKLAENNS